MAMDTLNQMRSANRTTRAAEGLPRWRWTTADMVRLAELGAFTDNDHFELIGWEIVPMSPRGRRRELVREALAIAWTRQNAPGIWVSQEPQFNLSDDTYTEPDLVVRPEAIKMPDLCGGDALLVVEVARSSLKKDAGWKQRLYASFGIREYWVIDAENLVTLVYRSPTADGYADVSEQPPNAVLTPSLVAGLQVRLADFDLA